jgi:hypothetical protein
MLIYVLRWRPSWISDRNKKHTPCRGPSDDHSSAIHRLTLDPMGKCSNAFFSETTNIIKAKLYSSRHFEFHIGTKNLKFVEDHLMNIPVQFGFNHICSF